MSEKFDPKDFASFEELPEEKKLEFKPVEDGFVRETAIEDERKAELMAHTENSIRSEINRVVELAMSKVKEKNIIKKAELAGESAAERYDLEKLIEEYKNIENLQVVELNHPDCCEGYNLKIMQDAAYRFIGSGEVNSNTFVMKDCNGQYLLIKDKKIIKSIVPPWQGYEVRDKEMKAALKAAADYFDNILNKSLKSQ